MNKYFQLKIGLLPHGSNFINRQFPRWHDPCDAIRFPLIGPRAGYDRHLGTGVNVQSWKILPDKIHYAEILNDHGI